MRVAARLAAGELRDHKRIYAIIAVVLALTMTSYLLLTAYEQYMLQVTRDGIGTTITGDGMVLAPRTSLREAYGGAPRMGDADEMVQRLESTGKYHAVPRLTVQGVLQAQGQPPEGAIFRGIDPQRDEEVFALREKIVQGRYFRPSDPQTQGTLGRVVTLPPGVTVGNVSTTAITSQYADPYPIIVGKAFLDSRGLRVGEVLQATVQTGRGGADYTFANFRIIGAYEIGIPVMEQLVHFLPIASLQEATGWGAGAATEVAVKDARTQRLAEPEEVAADLAVLAPASQRYTWHDVLVYISGTLMDTVNLLLYGTMAVTLVLAAAAIKYVMDSIVLRKTREIGSLKAFGARDRTVLEIFLLQALVLGLAAGLLGVAAGYAVVAWARATGLQTEFLAGSAIKVDFVITPEAMLLTTLVPVALSLAASAIPARRAARLAPVEALRRGELAL